MLDNVWSLTSDDGAVGISDQMCVYLVGNNDGETWLCDLRSLGGFRGGSLWACLRGSTGVCILASFITPGRGKDDGIGFVVFLQ